MGDLKNRASLSLSKTSRLNAYVLSLPKIHTLPPPHILPFYFSSLLLSLSSKSSTLPSPLPVALPCCVLSLASSPRHHFSSCRCSLAEHGEGAAARVGCHVHRHRCALVLLLVKMKLNICCSSH